MTFFKPLDYRRWAEELDFVAWDSYPDPLPGLEPERMGAVGHDLMRSLKKDRPFVLMEQASSAVNWRTINGPKAPGRMRLGSLQTVARGGDGVMFFQWRASKAGAEKFHSGMIQHVDPAFSRVFGEIKQLGADLKALAPVGGSIVRARVAIAFDWHAWWALELESKPGRIDYAGWAQELHRYFYARNIAVDFVHPGAALTDYALVVAPALYLLTKADADNLTDFVARGGTLLATYFSGIVDEHEHVVLGGYPAWLRPVLGLWVEEWAPYAEGQTNGVRFAGARGAPVKTGHWCEVVTWRGRGLSQPTRTISLPDARRSRSMGMARVTRITSARSWSGQGSTACWMRVREGRGPGAGHARRSRGHGAREGRPGVSLCAQPSG